MISAYGAREVPISISGTPEESRIIQHTIRAVGAATRSLVALRVGDSLGVRGPFGSGWPLALAQQGDVVIVAGGLGLAPLRSAILHILAHREKYRRLVVFYGARTPHDLLYRRELERWRSRLDAEVRVVVDRADDTWYGSVGNVTSLFGQLEEWVDPASVTAMVCGPEVMMRFTVRDLLRHGVSKDRIYLSLERNMQCGVGFCGHCQYGPYFLCRDGPVLPYSRIEFLFNIREV